MEVRVAGHQVDTGDALRHHVSERLNAMTEKYFSRAIGANVTFGRAPHDQFTCDIVAPVSNGHVLKASNRAGDAHIAFDGAADKVERQLKRYAERLRERRSEPMPEIPADAGYRVIESSNDEDTPTSDSPAIVAETHVDIPTASVGDAVMMLDLRNTNALLFKNGGSGALNMVYRREDGTIGWVEPSQG
ncbi:ribosome hibernation-promoting factor, HPF/YfiA family [Sphingomicrobium sediminis]|uniref:Ribosome hibernation promoting factor n=1 Tax=Sphingomicrobium sediminis TaxID=2950949 RepID=A0A9X2EHF0_9SPHN|nr:ribosome-associated translation inhibitor RaiA [Sphingomicrobium sediminis]MCM8558088.1 ribosome-associated translation inhibitor RaiA [Sphingomicrobium sediminis]